MSDLGERMARIETSQGHILNGIDRIEKGQTSLITKYDTAIDALCDKDNALQGQIDATGKDLTWAKWIGTSFVAIIVVFVGWMISLRDLFKTK